MSYIEIIKASLIVLISAPILLIFGHFLRRCYLEQDGGIETVEVGEHPKVLNILIVLAVFIFLFLMIDGVVF